MFKFSSFIFLTLIFLIASCSENGTDPKPKPPGYQEDIPWPSLADSPWPMYRHDPQNTGRTNYPGPSLGEFEWIMDSVGVNSGSAVGEDSTIYFVSNSIIHNDSSKSGLVALYPDGAIKWIYPIVIIPIDSPSPPLVAADGTIYTTAPNEEKLVAVNPNGTLKWSLDDVNVRSASINIGIDGTLYFLEDYVNLYALNPQGKVTWILPDLDAHGDVGFSAFSPNGKTLYLPGYPGSSAILAVDLEEKAVKWTFGGPDRGLSPILVDSEGHVYVINIDDSSAVNLFSLNENGKTRWQFKMDDFFQANGYQTIAMDRFGNVYTGNDTLFALNYEGKLLWKKGYEFLYSPMVIDQDNNLYFDNSIGFFDREILALTNQGDIIWNLRFPLAIRSFYSLGLGYSGKLLYPSWRSTFFSTIK